MASNSLLERGGFDYQPVDDAPLESLMCTICCLLSREPHLSECCGYTFCKSCIDFARDSNPTMTCPVCRHQHFITFRNKQVERAIKTVRVFCINKDQGCEWQGEMNDTNRHISYACEFEEVKCSNNCGKVLQRHALARHVTEECQCRIVNCQYCQLADQFQIIEGSHKDKCPKFPVPCPNLCGTFPVRDDVNNHMTTCPLEKVCCKYQEIGCEARIARQDKDKHNSEKVDDHLSHVISMQRKEINKLTQKLLEVENHLVATKQELKDTQQNLASTQQLLSTTQDNMKQQLFLVHQEFEKIQQSLVSNSDQALAVQTTLQEKIKEVESFVQKRIAALASAVERKMSEAERKQQSKSLIIEKNLWPSYVKKEAANLAAGDQIVPVVVQLSDYSSKKKDHLGWYSNSFYTHLKGYKMCLSIDIVGFGDGIGTHLSVGLVLLKGPYDDRLTWPLKGQCEVKLLNQITDSEHHTDRGSYSSTECFRVPIKGKRRSYPLWGSSQFITYDDLHKTTTTCQYLKNNNIFFHVDYKLDQQPTSVYVQARTLSHSTMSIGML